MTGEAGHSDSRSNGSLDPSRNVLDLVEAAINRLDDLNEAYRGHYDERFKLLDERLAREFDHVRELRVAEADRIDAIRAVDVGAVAAAAAVSATQAATLASTQVISAETLRNQVAAAATASTVALAAALDPIQKDIADLRRAQYEQQGQKLQVTETRSSAEDMKPLVDQIAQLVAAQNQAQGMKAQVAETREVGTGQRQSVGLWIAAAVGFAGLALSTLGIVVAYIVAHSQ